VQYAFLTTFYILNVHRHLWLHSTTVLGTTHTRTLTRIHTLQLPEHSTHSYDSIMGAHRIFPGVGKLGGLETKVRQRGPGWSPGGGLGAKPQKPTKNISPTPPLIFMGSKNC